MNAPPTPPPFGDRVALTPRSWIRHVPGWADAPDTVMAALTRELAWQQEWLHLYGRTVAQPRLTAVCGKSMDPASGYRRANPEQAWTPTAAAVLARVTDEVPGWQPNGLIANLYRNGADSIGWHADDEPALGPAPTVVSVSYGATRRFRLKPRSGGASVAVDLGHGDLLIMGGATQVEYLHTIAKTKRVTSPRLSLTLRHYR